MAQRDVLFQADPVAALRATAATFRAAGPPPRAAPCRLVLVADCACAAVRDDYFVRWGARCLPPPLLAAIGDGPPVNGGVVFGAAGALRALYAKALTLAAVPMDGEQYLVAGPRHYAAPPARGPASRLPLPSPPQCVAGGREQHLLTGAGHALMQLHPDEVCLLPNNLTQQHAVFNFGVNNVVSTVVLREATGPLEAPAGNATTVVLSEATGKLEAPGGGAVAVLHQWDRRFALKSFLRRHNATKLGLFEKFMRTS